MCFASRYSALRLGTVWINDYHPYVPQAEWGGFKQFGFGRELGPAPLADAIRCALASSDVHTAPARP
jgi:acyl-CoA reductase-like NAD-dependent aldehyde dehydrogenase